MANRRVKVKHCIVTDNCRKMHTNEGVLNMVIEELRQSFRSTIKHWPHGKQAEFHFEMYVEYPREVSVESTASQRPLREVSVESTASQREEN